MSGQQAQPPARRGRGRLLYIYEREAERERGQRVRDESGEERSRESSCVEREIVHGQGRAEEGKWGARIMDEGWLTEHVS